jgi:membrane associated rhomboid family serine protease
MRQITEIVKQLLIINILFFIGTQVVGSELAFSKLAMFFPENALFHFWQPLTHMFMHFGVLHIFFNMFALYSFGSTLESFWGGKKFLFFYISCGLGAILVHTLINYYFFNKGLAFLTENGITKTDVLALMNQGKINPQWQELMPVSTFNNFIESFAGNVVGASGAVYGLLIAFAYMFPNAELALMFIPIPIKAKYFVPAILCYDLYSGISGRSLFGGSTGIAHFAHLGGALVGFIMMWYWKKNQFDKHRWN